MDRAPGLSVRLKLTLSYAGFLMVAGVLLLAVVWVFLLRYIPDGVDRHGHPVGSGPIRSDLLRAFAPKGAIVLAFLLVFGLLGGWLLAGHMLAPLTRITDATRIGRDRVALPPDPAGGPQRRVPRARRRLRQPCSRGSKRTSPSSSGSRPTPPTSCARRWRSRRRCSTWPATIRAATTTSWSTASTSSTPARSTSPRRCSCSAAPTSGPSSENPSTCRSSPKKPPRRSSPSQRNAASPSRPPAMRRPPSAHPPSCCRWRRTSSTTRSSTTCPTRAPYGSRPALSPRRVVLTVENTGEKLTPQLVATLAEPFQRGTQAHPHRPRRRRPRPGHRQEHHPGARRNPHPHPRADGGLCVTVQLPAARG